MHLPIDYPRIDQFPEWFTVATDERDRIGRVGDGGDDTFSGQELHEGVPLELKPGRELRMIGAIADLIHPAP
jgi:hypothetical protein